MEDCVCNHSASSTVEWSVVDWMPRVVLGNGRFSFVVANRRHYHCHTVIRNLTPDRLCARVRVPPP